MNRVRVIVPAYQRPEWLAVCLRSLEVQDHPDFDVTVIDDASPDPDVSRIANDYAERLGWQVIRTAERGYPLASRCAGVTAAAPDDHDVLVFVDGDDWLHHAGALGALAGGIDDETWLSFGSMTSIATDPERYGRAAGLDPLIAERRRWLEQNRAHIVEQRAYRRVPWCFTHPFTCKAFLWKAIDPARSFRTSSGHWVRMCSDQAFTYPLLELAGGRFRFLDEIHYAYNLHSGNEDADPAGDRARVVTSRWLRSLPPLEPIAAAPPHPSAAPA